MSENNKPQKIDNSSDENPYLTSRKDWNEKIGREKASAAMWRMFAFLMFIPVILSIAGMIYASQLPDVVPFIFKEDASGGITPLGLPNTKFRAENRYIANQLSEFIVALREVPSSEGMRKISVHHVKMLADPVLFQKRLGTMLREEYAEVGTNEKLVTIKTILVQPNDKYTWEIDWTELLTGGTPVEYKALINYAQLSSFGTDPTELMWNPLNIVIKDITLNPVMGGSK